MKNIKTHNTMSNISSAAFADTKPHYNLLDGLRGVAAQIGRASCRERVSSPV